MNPPQKELFQIFLLKQNKEYSKLVYKKNQDNPGALKTFLIILLKIFNEFIDIYESSFQFKVFDLGQLKTFCLKNRSLIQIEHQQQDLICHLKDFDFNNQIELKINPDDYVGMVFINPEGKLILKTRGSKKAYLQCPFF